MLLKLSVGRVLGKEMYPYPLSHLNYYLKRFLNCQVVGVGMERLPSAPTRSANGAEDAAKAATPDCHIRLAEER